MTPPNGFRAPRRAAVLVLIGAMLPAVVPSAISPAHASSVYLCDGYRACSQAGMSDFGYGAENDQMYWRMYSGHNCTNYVAYRLIQAGMPSERPWSGTGMAYNWGPAMRDITDKTPAVGAVAWWERNASGAGSSGHVAIVEQVVSETEIIISEDSWSGDFHWRRIIKDGTSWPTGFIHFVDKAVVNVVPPRITGTAQVGSTLRVAKGRWKPAASYSYQWLSDLVPIEGATAQTFAPGPEEVGSTISARVTASKVDRTPGVVDAPATGPVARGELVSTAPPAVSGEGEVDAVLTATPGTWSAVPDGTEVRWKSDGRIIPGASAPQLTLTRAMVGTTITAVEIARRAGFVNGAALAPQAVGPVVEGVIEVVTPISPSGPNRNGSELTLSPGTTNPSDVTVTYTWLRDGVVVSGADAATYQVTDADVGRLITAEVTLSKPRYRSIARTFSFARTTTPSTLDVTAAGRKRKAAVQVRVTAPGAEATGPVQVTVGKATTTSRLIDGVARVVLESVKPGERTVKVHYLGDGVATAERARAQVLVKKGRKKRT
ncbi:MAG: CHAP domain-containing protein [Nocardioides sp.]